MATLSEQDRAELEKQLREKLDALEQLRTEREQGEPFDTNRAEFTINQAALLCAEIQIREGGFLDTNPSEMLERRWNDRYERAREIRVDLILAVEAGKFRIIPARNDDGAVDPRRTILSRDELKPWCEAHGLRPSFLFRESEDQPAVPGAREFDARLHATREQLIAAFGAFAGMNETWFRNLKDTPALLSARKFAGQGGRGHIREPYFCPFEVMQWVANPKRKKGRPVSRDKCWDLLERHFPQVYALHSAADPRD